MPLTTPCNIDTVTPNIADLGCVLTNLIQALLGAVGFVAGIFVLRAAAKLASSQGDPKAMASAKAHITWALVGVLVSLGAIAIIRLFGNFVGYNLLPSQISIPTNLYP